MMAPREVTIRLPYSEWFALMVRSDLVKELVQTKCDRRFNWRGMEKLYPIEGTRGGSSLDRALIVSAFARMERSRYDG